METQTRRWLDQGEIGEAFGRLGFFLWRDPQEVGFEHHRTCPDEDACEEGECWTSQGYMLIGQTDESATWAIPCDDDPDLAEVVGIHAGGVTPEGGFTQDQHVVNLLRALGWTKVQDGYVQTDGYFIP